MPGNGSSSLKLYAFARKLNNLEKVLVLDMPVCTNLPALVSLSLVYMIVLLCCAFGENPGNLAVAKITKVFLGKGEEM